MNITCSRENRKPETEKFINGIIVFSDSFSFNAT